MFVARVAAMAGEDGVLRRMKSNEIGMGIWRHRRRGARRQLLWRYATAGPCHSGQYLCCILMTDHLVALAMFTAYCGGR